MSAHEVITIMSKLKSLHESLLKLSYEKTDLLKEGKIDAFQKLLVNENKHVQAVRQLEEKRGALTEQWFSQQGLAGREHTVSEMLEHLKDGEEKDELHAIFENMVVTVAELKQQEQLNQDLLQQSLQFVELSLDMLQPTMKNMNYSENQKFGNPAQNRSVFDSKA
ncbi:flagellar protein FlgN [Virgibacillus sp. MSP4-1]|uniref:flagellar protein FlgN n=1 Tax=Virgibacillus sp. MSP4-1 TaxID=2700081 RepID=UPI0003A1035F|nr:flagellar protein FlgN [Virgibacillus sp. MSP4-1]QHS23294.1 flagellar protein FlgN [Virgibacillus sp. MSP4-1]